MTFEKESIWNRLIKGMGANLLGQFIHLASRVLLVPLFLKVWGIEIYGEWLALTSFVAYLSLMDLGGQIYIVNRLTQAFALRDIKLFRQILHTGLAVFLMIPLIGLAVFITVILLVTPETFLNLSQTSHQTVVWILVILGIQFVVSLPQGILLGVYRAVGTLPRGVMLGNLIQFLQFGFVAIGLWLGIGTVGIAVLQVLPFPIVTILATVELNRRFPEFSFWSLTESRMPLAKSFIKPSLHFFVIQIGQALSVQGMILIVSMLLGAAQVVLFSTLRTMVHVLKQMLGLIIHTAWPEITRLDTHGNRDRLFFLFRVIFRSTLVLTGLSMIFFHFLGQAVYDFWMGGQVEYSRELMDLLLIYIFLQVFWTACGNILMAVNNHQKMAKIVSIASAATIGTAYVGGLFYGLYGVILGMIASDLLLAGWIIPHLLNQYDKRFSFPFFVQEAVPVFLGYLSAGVFPWITPFVIAGLIYWWKRGIPYSIQEIWKRWK